MTFTVTYREKNGAKVQEPGSRPAPRRLPESRRVKRPVIGGDWKYSKSRWATQGGKEEERLTEMSNLLGLDITKHVVAKLLRPAEEPGFVDRESYAATDLVFKQTKRTCEVCYLEESVFARLYGLGELDGAWQRRRGNALKKIGNGFLSAVVIDLYAPVGGEHVPVAGGEVGELPFKGCRHLGKTAGISLVDGEAVVGEVDLAGESHHAMEYPSAEVAGHETESVVAVQNGAGVEAKILDADSLKSACKFHRCRFYRKTLVVQDKPKNVEPRCRGWFAKDSRFVHEQTQCSALSHRLINKSDGNCFTSLKAEDFPRITTTPVLKPTSACILPNRRAVGKCKSLKITFLDMEEEAA